MRCHLVLIALLSTLLCAYQSAPETNSYPGVLYRWSQQTVSSDKVVLFVHGRRLDIPNSGPSQALLESVFSFKMNNFETIGRDELFGKPTSEIVEYWLYGYYPQQSPETIAEDLARQIESNPDLRGKKIAIVGYSEGGLVCWLLDQNYDLIHGGVLLGAPILGSPLATKSMRDAAVKNIVGEKVGENISTRLNQWARGTEWLHNEYAKTTDQPHSQLMLYAGRIKPCSSAKLVYNLLDIIGDIGVDFLSGAGFDTSNRKFAESLALVISHCEWRRHSKTDRDSDGIVPVSSATVGARTQIWEDYDHYDLITGKLELTLDRAILRWLGLVLQLSPEFAESDSIPNLPEGGDSFSQIDLPSLPEINLTSADLAQCRFAYVHQGNLALSDRNWAIVKEFDLSQQCEYPRFAPDGKSLVFSTQQTVCQISGGLQTKAVTPGRYADFSPNGEWLAYESGAGLCTWRFTKQKQYCVVKDVRLVCPPLWVTKGLLGRIYFVAQANDGTTNLYVVSPRARNKDLGKLKKVLADCRGLFLARGLVSGVVAISGQKDKYQLSIVSNWLESNISFEITPPSTADGNESFDWDNFNFHWSTNRPLSLQSAVLDQTDRYALYLELPDEATQDPGIYLFSLTGKLDNFSLDFDYEISKVVADACNLDLNPVAN